jgi:hypothetical protein
MAEDTDTKKKNTEKNVGNTSGVLSPEGGKNPIDTLVDSYQRKTGGNTGGETSAKESLLKQPTGLPIASFGLESGPIQTTLKQTGKDILSGLTTDRRILGSAAANTLSSVLPKGAPGRGEIGGIFTSELPTVPASTKLTSTSTPTPLKPTPVSEPTIASVVPTPNSATTIPSERGFTALPGGNIQWTNEEGGKSIVGNVPEGNKTLQFRDLGGDKVAQWTSEDEKGPITNIIARGEKTAGLGLGLENLKSGEVAFRDATGKVQGPLNKEAMNVLFPKTEETIGGEKVTSFGDKLGLGIGKPAEDSNRKPPVYGKQSRREYLSEKETTEMNPWGLSTKEREEKWPGIKWDQDLKPYRIKEENVLLDPGGTPEEYEKRRTTEERTQMVNLLSTVFDKINNLQVPSNTEVNALSNAAATILHDKRSYTKDKAGNETLTPQAANLMGAIRQAQGHLAGAQANVQGQVAQAQAAGFGHFAEAVGGILSSETTAESNKEAKIEASKDRLLGQMELAASRRDVATEARLGREYAAEVAAEARKEAVTEKNALKRDEDFQKAAQSVGMVADVISGQKNFNPLLAMHILDSSGYPEDKVPDAYKPVMKQARDEFNAYVDRWVNHPNRKTNKGKPATKDEKRGLSNLFEKKLRGSI